MGRREDGYHDIASIMQAVDLHDTLSLESADELTLECDVPELATDDNLVLRAANVLREETGYESGARLSLRSAYHPPQAWAEAAATPPQRWSASTICGDSG